MKNKKLYKWFSICSIHSNYTKGCNCCENGKWIYMPAYYIEHIFYKMFPWLWKWYKNRPKRKNNWLDKFVNRKTGEKENPFPNLRKNEED